MRCFTEAELAAYVQDKINDRELALAVEINEIFVSLFTSIGKLAPEIKPQLDALIEEGKQAVIEEMKKKEKRNAEQG